MKQRSEYILRYDYTFVQVLEDREGKLLVYLKPDANDVELGVDASNAHHPTLSPAEKEKFFAKQNERLTFVNNIAAWTNEKIATCNISVPPEQQKGLSQG